jgi:hypothetical protein
MCIAAQILWLNTHGLPLPYALDPSALGLVSSGFLSPTSRLNAGGALDHGNYASAVCVCVQGWWRVYARMTEGLCKNNGGAVSAG